MTTTCIVCNKEFRSYDSRRAMKFCSSVCYLLWRKEHSVRNKHNCKCKICGKTFYLKPSSIKQGMGVYCSRECKHFSQRERAKIVGESYNDRHLLRQSSAYKKWRRNALKLHSNKCDTCGVGQHSLCECCGTTVYLSVHHIEKFSNNVERRFDPSNSSVLCPKCHRALENNGVNSVEVPTEISG